MSDESTFIADPSRIKAGADATGQVADVTNRAAEQYADATAYDPQDPPWGNDAYGKAYFANYGIHATLREGMRSLYLATQSAADMTKDAGRSFENAMNDNTDAVRNMPDVTRNGPSGPHTHL